LDMEAHVVIDPKFYRPAEVDILLGDSSKARAALGWAPETSLDQLIREMVDADLERLKHQANA
ncbi:GDP-mannose 4,6-dehydratase, partial [Methylosinus sporium]